MNALRQKYGISVQLAGQQRPRTGGLFTSLTGFKLLSLTFGMPVLGHAQKPDINDLPDTALIRRFKPPMVDRVRFEPLLPEQRLLVEPKVKVLARKDGYEFCSRITGIPVGPNSRPMACAYWNVKRGECTVVTPEVTGYNYLGHELRHCFEGAFHD